MEHANISLGVIVLLGFLLLMLAFRSLLVPATAALIGGFYLARGAVMCWVCDLNLGLLTEIGGRFPGVPMTQDFDRVLADPAVRAIAIAVDAPNHFGLAKRALQSGRHVFVEI